MSLNVFAQAQAQTSEHNYKSQAYKFDEYRKITIKKLEPRLRKFFMEIVESCSRGGITETCGTGNIVVYAPNENRTNLLLKPLRYYFREHSAGFFFDRFNLTRVTLIRVRDKHEKTEFWFIPKSAKPPIFEKTIKSEKLKN